MRLDANTMFWVVINPGPESTVEDILSACDLDMFRYYMVGSGHGDEGRPSRLGMVLYSEADEAKADAAARLAAR